MLGALRHTAHDGSVVALVAVPKKAFWVTIKHISECLYTHWSRLLSLIGKCLVLHHVHHSTHIPKGVLFSSSACCCVCLTQLIEVFVECIVVVSPQGSQLNFISKVLYYKEVQKGGTPSHELTRRKETSPVGGDLGGGDLLPGDNNNNVVV